MLRTIYIAIILLILSISAYAQDVMVRKNDNIIEGKVIEVGIDRVVYKISKDLNSASFIIRKSELKRIEFENGQTVFFNERDNPKNKRATANSGEEYGRNMINISLFKALDSGPGFGINYETLVDKRGYFGITLPLSMVFPDNYIFVYDSGSQGVQTFYFSPGLKIYPFGQRKVTYAVGPNVFTGLGNKKIYNSVYDTVTGTYVSQNINSKNFRLGILVNNYVNFQVTPSFQIGLNGGLGVRYIDKEKFASQVRSNGISITGEFNFSLGFRF